MLAFQHWPSKVGLLEKVKYFAEDALKISATDSKTIAAVGGLKLLKYESKAKGNSLSPILIIPSFINRHYVLDLLPEMSLIKYLTESGRTVYLIDWGVPDSADKYFKIESFFDLHLPVVLLNLKRDSGWQKVHLLGHCLGGTLSLISALLRPKDFYSIVNLTTPVNFSDSTKISVWARTPQFDEEAFAEAYGNIPWPILQFAFLGVKPTQLLSKYRHFLYRIKDKRFVKNFIALETWANDNVNVRGLHYHFLVNTLYKKNSLANADISLCGTNLNLKNLETPLLDISASADHIVDESCLVNRENLDADLHFERLVAKGGHVGAVIGAKAKEQVWPKILDWVMVHDV